MGEAKRRSPHKPDAPKPRNIPTTIVQDVDDCVEQIVSKISDTVVFGPLVKTPIGEAPINPDVPAALYFTMGTGKPDGTVRFMAISVVDPQDRDRIVMAVAMDRRLGPRVIHDTDDELAMLQWCEAIWPGERVTRIRKATEEERRRAAH